MEFLIILFAIVAFVFQAITGRKQDDTAPRRPTARPQRTVTVERGPTPQVAVEREHSQRHSYDVATGRSTIGGDNEIGGSAEIGGSSEIGGSAEIGGHPAHSSDHEPDPQFHRTLSPNAALQGMMWAEIFGKPRALNPRIGIKRKYRK